MALICYRHVASLIYIVGGVRFGTPPTMYTTEGCSERRIGCHRAEKDRDYPGKYPQVLAVVSRVA